MSFSQMLLSSPEFGIPAEDSTGREEDLPKNNFHRLVEYIVYILPYFLQSYIEKGILQNQTLHDVLENQKHSFFHLFMSRRCSECGIDYRVPNKVLTKEQFNVLYMYENKSKKSKKCQKCDVHPCPCVIRVNPDVTMKALDIKLVSYVFKDELSTDAQTSLKEIIDTRNNVFHLSESNNVTQTEFNRYWGSLSTSLKKIIGREYWQELEKEEKRVLSQVFSSSAILQEQTLLSDVYKDRNEALELQLALLPQTSEEKQLCEERIRKHQERLEETINTLDFYLYQTAVSIFGNKSLRDLFDNEVQVDTFDKKTIPVLLQMEVPDDFNKADIAKSIEQLAINFKADNNGVHKVLEIYTGELKILLEIITKVARNREELQQKIKNLVFDILEISKIDTTRASSVAVTLSKIDDKGGLKVTQQPPVTEGRQGGLSYEVQGGDTSSSFSPLPLSEAVLLGHQVPSATGNVENNLVQTNMVESLKPTIIPASSVNAEEDAEVPRKATEEIEGLKVTQQPPVTEATQGRLSYEVQGGETSSSSSPLPLSEAVLLGHQVPSATGNVENNPIQTNMVESSRPTIIPASSLNAGEDAEVPRKATEGIEDLTVSPGSPATEARYGSSREGGFFYDAQRERTSPSSSPEPLPGVVPLSSRETLANMENINDQNNMMEKSRPTIVPANPFNAELDAKILNKAITEIGTDDKAFVDVVSRRSNKQRQEIEVVYKTLYRRELQEDLQLGKSCDLVELILALFRPRTYFDAYSLHKAMFDHKKRRSVLSEILLTRTNKDITEIADCYQKNYGRRLAKDIGKETSEHFERIFVSADMGSRTELTPEEYGVESVIDRNIARRKAQKLNEGGIKKLATNEYHFWHFIVFNHYYEFRAIFEEYHKLTGKDILSVVKEEISGDPKHILKALVKVATNRHKYFAERLNKAIFCTGADISTLIRIIVCRSEIDLQNIKDEYNNMYQKTLHDDIASVTVGDFRELLLGIVGF